MIADQAANVLIKLCLKVNQINRHRFYQLKLHLKEQFQPSFILLSKIESNKTYQPDNQCVFLLCRITLFPLYAQTCFKLILDNIRRSNCWYIYYTKHCTPARMNKTCCFILQYHTRAWYCIQGVHLELRKTFCLLQGLYSIIWAKT